jgi:eukaryotic-like serine/threonine-protein kinase
LCGWIALEPPIRTVATSNVWSHPNLSSDGNRVAFERPDPKTRRNNLWIADATRGTTSQFSYDAVNDGVPVWSPNGDRIVFNSVREGSRNLYWKSTGGGSEELLLNSGESTVPSDWSMDGRFILFSQGDERKRLWDIWALPLSGDRKPFPVVQSPYNESSGQFSPDGRWIVYASNESGTPEIYAQPFRANHPASQGTSERVQITNGGGVQPRWRRDGRELFYLNQDSRIMAVAVEFEPKFDSRNPRPLFKVRGARPFGDLLYDYDVTPDGQRFLFNLLVEGAVSPITVVVNWDAALK